MKNYKLNLIYFSLLVFSFTSCKKDKGTAIEFEEVLEIEYKETAKMLLANMEIQFAEVIEESRCPLDVFCTHAGRVTVKIGLTTLLPPVDTASIQLSEGESDTINLIIFTLLEVNPYPASSESPVLFKEKKIKLRVESY